MDVVLVRAGLKLDRVSLAPSTIRTGLYFEPIAQALVLAPEEFVPWARPSHAPFRQFKIVARLLRHPYNPVFLEVESGLAVQLLESNGAWTRPDIADHVQEDTRRQMIRFCIDRGALVLSELELWCHGAIPSTKEYRLTRLVVVSKPS
jgi:hypothetical protein